jgi:formate hydrogenlyase transcriptional activator
LLELANGSTVFLDEVADLPTETQASLARVLQSHEIQPVGTSHPIKVDLRVIAASRRDLVGCIQEGTFRDDLYYRLNVLPIHVPPLRERTEDIPLLVWRFVDEFSQTYGKTIETIDQDSMEQLQRYRWPGNARELRNVVERAMIVATGRRLRIVLPVTAGGSRGSETLAAVEKAHITAVLAACGGKVRGKGGAAARLGLSPRALEAMLTKLRIRRQSSP